MFNGVDICIRRPKSFFLRLSFADNVFTIEGETLCLIPQDDDRVSLSSPSTSTSVAISRQLLTRPSDKVAFLLGNAILLASTLWSLARNTIELFGATQSSWFSYLRSLFKCRFNVSNTRATLAPKLAGMIIIVVFYSAAIWAWFCSISLSIEG